MDACARSFTVSDVIDADGGWCVHNAKCAESAMLLYRVTQPVAADGGLPSCAFHRVPLNGKPSAIELKVAFSIDGVDEEMHPLIVVMMPIATANALRCATVYANELRDQGHGNQKGQLYAPAVTGDLENWLIGQTVVNHEAMTFQRRWAVPYGAGDRVKRQLLEYERWRAEKPWFEEGARGYYASLFHKHVPQSIYKMEVVDGIETVPVAIFARIGGGGGHELHCNELRLRLDFEWGHDMVGLPSDANTSEDVVLTEAPAKLDEQTLSDWPGCEKSDFCVAMRRSATTPPGTGRCCTPAVDPHDDGVHGVARRDSVVTLPAPAEELARMGRVSARGQGPRRESGQRSWFD
jgi:hypothetical protein